MVLAFLSTLSLAAGPQATPGKWEITTNMSMQGPQGNMAMPAHTNSICIKPEDAANIQRHFSNGPGGQQRDKDCKVLDQTMTGDTVKFHLKCDGAHASEATGQISYAADSYKGHVDMTAAGPKGPMHMTMDFNGKRVGGC
jgi:hypothetical protein